MKIGKSLYFEKLEGIDLYNRIYYALTGGILKEWGTDNLMEGISRFSIYTADGIIDKDIFKKEIHEIILECNDKYEAVVKVHAHIRRIYTLAVPLQHSLPLPIIRIFQVIFVLSIMFLVYLVLIPFRLINWLFTGKYHFKLNSLPERLMRGLSNYIEGE